MQATERLWETETEARYQMALIGEATALTSHRMTTAVVAGQTAEIFPIEAKS